MLANNNKNRIHGFSLIESMIAIAVFSFGLLGIAGLMGIAVKSNHNGYMRSQATLLVSNIFDAMRRNPKAVWSNQYNGTYSGYSTVAGLCQTACNEDGLAARDLALWSNMMTQILPNSSGSISCESPAAMSAATNDALFFAIEPYNGFCQVEINWTESNKNSDSSAQKISWTAKP